MATKPKGAPSEKSAKPPTTTEEPKQAVEVSELDTFLANCKPDEVKKFEADVKRRTRLGLPITDARQVARNQIEIDRQDG